MTPDVPAGQIAALLTLTAVALLAVKRRHGRHPRAPYLMLLTAIVIAMADPRGLTGMTAALALIAAIWGVRRWWRSPAARPQLEYAAWRTGQALMVPVRWVNAYIGHGLSSAARLLSPTPPGEAADSGPQEQHEVSESHDTQVTALVVWPHGDRWGLMTPARTGTEPALTPADTTADTDADTTHSVTYEQWLPTSPETAGGFNAAARTAHERWGHSRAKFARDLRTARTDTTGSAAA